MTNHSAADVRIASQICRYMLLAFLIVAMVLPGARPAYAATIIVNSAADTVTASDGACTLREAINNANSSSDTTGGDCVGTGPNAIINFNIPGSGLHTIALASALPLISASVTIDGSTQPGASCAAWPPTLQVEIDATNSGGIGLRQLTGSLTMRGLVLNRYTSDGVFLEGASSGSTFQCNFIGTNAAGTAASGNGQSGIFANGANNNVIGGTAAGQGNLLAGNNIAQQLRMAGSSGNTIQGNYIGVNVTGTAALGGSNNEAILITGSNNQIGGTTGTTPGGACTGACNVIAGAMFYQIWISAPGVTGTVVQGNHIGVNAAGNAPLGGAQVGVRIDGGATNTTIGGTAAGAGNLISGSSRAGVVVNGDNTTNNTIRGNSIFDNTGLGIDLGNDGVTFNHQGNATGPNSYQNYPVLTLATSGGGSTRVAGTLTGQGGALFNIDVYANPTCDPTSFGEGRTYIGTIQMGTSDGGVGSFDETLTADVPEPQGITATATNASTGDTSEFSYCRPVSTTNLNWVQASDMVEGTAQQYITDRLQEKWFKFPVQPGDTVHVKLTSLPGSAVSLHRDPFPFYNGLTNPQSAAVLSAEAADSAFLPSGSLPSGSLPSGSLPSGSLPSGSLPSGSLPTGFLPSGSLPSGSLPSGSLPSGSLPSGSLPSGSLPSGSLPSGSLPSGSLPSGSLPSGSLPSGSLPSGSLPANLLPSGSLPSGSLDAYSSAARRSLLGIAMDPYATVQTIDRNTYDLQENLYVRVVGPYSLTTPFTLQVQIDAGVCGAINPISNSLSVIAGGAPGGSYKSLILTNSSRLAGTPPEISTALADLGRLASRPDVDGVVIDLADAKYQRVAAAYQQSDRYLACPSARNMVADEIKSVIDAYRAANTSGGATTLQYIVLAGGANVIPFSQVRDVAGLANEKEYVVPVAPSTASEAGLKSGLVQGQDMFGSQTDLTQAGLTIAVPDLAVGRLVDSASDISTAINAYIATNGVVSPHSSLVTGYDFVGDAAAAIKTEAQAGIGATPDTLIQAPGLPPTDPSAWTADQLRAKLLNPAGRPDLAVLTGHFSAGNLLAADYQTKMDASEIAQSTVNLSNIVVLALGCHGGYSVPSTDLLAGVSPSPDWAKAFLRRGAAGFVSATGYAYGDTELTEYGERLFVELAQQLRTGSGPIALGKALVAAKRQYLAETAQLTGIDQKTIVEMTLYGLPMMKVDMPGQRISPPSEASIVGSTAPVADGPGSGIGLSSGDASLSPSITSHSVPLKNLADGSTVNTTYFSGADGVVANPFEPIFPKQIDNISVSGEVLRGLAFRGGTYADQPGVVPLTTAPATETSNANRSFYTSVFYPNQTALPNFYDAVSGGATRLVSFPAQFKSSAPGAIDGTLRKFSALNFRLYYLPSDWAAASNSATVKAAAVSAAPTIIGASAIANTGTITFSVNAQADGSAGVQAVWVLYTGKPGSTFYGQWRPLDLATVDGDPTLWQGTLALPSGANAGDIQFMVQAVGGAGLTTLGTNLGAYYSVANTTSTPPPPPATTTMTLVGPTSGVYLKNASFTLTLKAGATALGGKLVTLDIGGQQAQAITNSSGQAAITLKPIVTPGSYTAQASFAGESAYLSSTAAKSFTLAPDTTSVSITPSSATVQLNQATPIVAVVRDSSGRALGGKSVFFIVHNGTQSFVRSAIANYLGNAILGAVPLPVGSYTVDAYFGGSIPVDATHTLTLSDDDYTSSKQLGASLTITSGSSDTTPPTITINGVSDGAKYILGAAPTPSCTATDSGSGLAAPCSGTLTRPTTANGVGKYVYTATAKDNAGNTATVSATYWIIYRFDGFLQPINDTARPQICGSPCLTSIFKGGSTVPVKFQLKNASGATVQANSLPLWIAPQKGSAMSAPVDESVYSGAATGGTMYRWDSTAQQYIYNWGTKGFASGFYWRIGVTLDDGQTYYVTVGLR